MTSRTMISIAVASAFLCSASSAATPKLNYNNQADVLYKDSLPAYSSIQSSGSSVTFEEAIGTAGSVFDTDNGTVSATASSRLVFKKGLHASSSGYQKNGLSVTNQSSVTVNGDSSVKTSGYLGDAIVVKDNSTLTFENAGKIDISSSGNSTSGLVAETSTVALINSNISSLSSNSVIGIKLKDSVFNLDQSTVKTGTRSLQMEGSSIAMTQSTLDTYRVLGSGSISASDKSALNIAQQLKLDGSVSLTDSSLTTKGSELSNGTLSLSGTAGFKAESLKFNNGKLNLSGESGQSFEVGALTGGKVDYTLGNTDAAIKIDSADVTDLTLHGSGALNDASSGDASKALGYFGFDQVTNADGIVLDMKEGMYQGSSTVVFDSNNAIVSQVTRTNSLMLSTLELASVAPLSLNRILTNDVHKRMGDIRSMKGTNGAWARYDGGSLSGRNGLENDFHTIQVGVDTVSTPDLPRVGVAFSYTKSDADYRRGEADMDVYSLAAYGLWMKDNGQFVDVVARLGTAKTDMTVDGDKTGSTDNIVAALSGEFGWRFDLTQAVYFEPQLEIAYTHVDADDLSLSDGSNYRFDNGKSLMGRAGFALGLQCPENGSTAYLHVSAVHEFLGDHAVTGGDGTVVEFDGKDTWVEYGLGASINVTDSSYVWADVERTSGGILDEDYRATVGVRYAF